MRLTLARVRSETGKAVKPLGATVVSAAWIGKRTKERYGSAQFRVARVVLAANDGWKFTKHVTVDTTGYVRIA